MTSDMKQTKCEQMDALPTGSTVHDYVTESILGRGGFGIVYQARHLKDGSRVAIKEYLPAELAIRIGGYVQPRTLDCTEPFEGGLQRFSDEAQRIREFTDCPNIVTCQDFFRANGTAYLVMEYEDGISLSELLRLREEQGDPIGQDDLLAVTVPLLQALRHIHSAGVLHRDIKPSNVLVRREDEQPVLIDFGAAKQAVADRTKSLAPYTDGYAAIEQVGEGDLGTWTDVYGIGALMWRMVAGGNPPWSPPNPTRVENRASAVVRGVPDPLPPAVQLGAGRFSRPILEGIDKALALRESERVQNTDELLSCLQEKEISVHQVSRRPHRGAGWGIAACLTIGGVLLLAATGINMVSTDPSGVTARFTVETRPTNARVRLVDSDESYTPGMRLRPGSYQIEVSAPGYESRTMQVKHEDSGSRARVTLSRLHSPQRTQPTIERASFAVSTIPINATVSLLDSATPYRSGMELALGSYMVEVSADGYRTRRVLIAHRESSPYSVKLERVSQPFTVETDPATAQVELLGVDTAYKPGVSLPPGLYRVKVSESDYESATVEVRHEDSPSNMRIVLKRIAVPPRAIRLVRTAAFNVTSEPSEARVVLLNSAIQYRQGMELEFGSYLVEVSANGYVSRRVSIEHRGSLPHEIKLDRRPATFTVRSDPPNARIQIVNSKLQYEEGMRLSPGLYVIRVLAPGYNSKIMEIDHSYKPTVTSIALERNAYLTLGSHQNEVIALHGTPSAVTRIAAAGHKVWHYGSSTVTIDARSESVVSWDDAGDLKLRPSQESPVARPTHFTVGSHLDDLIQVQGAPSAINRFGAGVRETWHYGRSIVVVDSRTRRVVEIHDTGNLKTKP